MVRRFFSSKWFQFFILFFILCGVAYLATANYSINKTLRNYAFDTFNRMDERPALDKVIIADIDEKSLEKIGQWPWPRDVIADMVLKLKDMGAKAIAFDMVFAEPDRMSPKRFGKGLLDKGLIDHETKAALENLPDNDEILSAAFKQAGNVVTGFTYAKPEHTRDYPRQTKEIIIKPSNAYEIINDIYKPEGVVINSFILSDGAVGNASFIASPSNDGRIRRLAVIQGVDLGYGTPLVFYPTLAIESLRVYYNSKEHIKVGEVRRKEDTIADQMKSWQEKNYTVRVGSSGWNIPIKKDGKIYLKFRKLDREKDYISVSDIIQNKNDATAKIKDKIVLVGTSAEGLRDIRNTAIQAFIPGVEVHFNFIEQVMQGIYLFRDKNVSMIIELFAIGICGGVLVIASLYFGPIILTLMTSLFLGGIFTGTFYLYQTHNLLFDPVNPSIAILTIFIVAALVNYLRSELSKREIRDAFGLYISPDFMEELTDNPDKLSLGGEIRDLTVMFTDIRNFTTISESMTPEDLIITMNDFLTPMSDVVMKRRGTIDKYMGDAMMAFWNAPLDDDNHARNAVLAALDMKAALEPVNIMLAERAAKTGEEPLRLSAGIGINSGPCAVGNMGSKQRFAYSALGDAVNLASRLEGQTKSYGLDLLIGEDTVQSVNDFAVVDIDLIQVKGKTKPVQIYTVLGDETVAQNPEFQTFIADHNQFIDAYREGDFNKAESFIETCMNHEQAYELQTYYTVMQARINDMNKKTPPQWDGVYIATSK